MGSLEAYLGASLFSLFGSSLFSLRSGLILLFALFLISTYLLTSLLYSKSLAFISVGVLSLGSSYMIERQLSAIGGYPETLAFGSLVFLCAVWLAVTYNPTVPLRKQGWRFAAYFCWGLCAGLGLWSDLLIAPFVAGSGLLLLFCCWRELLRILAVVCIAVGLAIGAVPLVMYNLRPVPGEDSFTLLLKLLHGGSTHANYTLAYLLKEVIGTIQVSIPMMTGNPFCPVSEIAFLDPSSPKAPQCTAIHTLWSLGYLLLFALAVFLTLWTTWKAWRHYTKTGKSVTDKQEFNRNLGCLMLLSSAILALLFYTLSNAPIDWPGIHGRYLIGLLIATPAVLWPLWSGFEGAKQPIIAFSKLRAGMCAVMLFLIGSMLMIGTIHIFVQDAPIAQAENQHYQSLITHLLQIHATHIYTDYWTCDKIAFVSQEQIICGVIDSNLQPTHNRDARYYDSVSKDPHSAYVFPINGQPAYGAATPNVASTRSPAMLPHITLFSNIEKKMSKMRITYNLFAFDGYIIYQPN